MSLALCRDCARLGRAAEASTRCPACGSPRRILHPELDSLAIAHIDCDAFYASVEKQRRPELAELPVIVGGGGQRGVVLACCYVARLYGIRSAMPMFKALAACPHATVIRPDMAAYREVGLAVREAMRALTPLVEPLSIDEAFLDLSGTERLHGAPPSVSLARLALEIEARLGITVSVGLSYNKHLAKIASDLDKPRGFAVLGRADGPGFLASQGVSMLWGVGPALQRRLSADGITRIGQLAALGERELQSRYGKIGRRLARLAAGEDDRPVSPDAMARSISAETTFETDQDQLEPLSRALWPLCERVAQRLKQKSVAAGGVTLKLKTARFHLRTRSRRLADPTQFAETLFRTGRSLLQGEVDGRTRFRLIGIGADMLADARTADLPTLFDRPRRLDETIAALREKLGSGSIGLGRDLPMPDRSGAAKKR